MNVNDLVELSFWIESTSVFSKSESIERVGYDPDFCRSIATTFNTRALIMLEELVKAETVLFGNERLSQLKNVVSMFEKLQDAPLISDEQRNNFTELNREINARCPQIL